MEEPVGLLKKYGISAAQTDLGALDISEWLINNGTVVELPWGTSSPVVNDCTRAYCAAIYSDPGHSECVHAGLIYPTDLGCGDPTAYQCQELVRIQFYVYRLMLYR